MIELQLIERIRKDCEEKGHGRKKWWAQTLGIHQQTLSYWLHGNRTPRSHRLEQISNYFSIMKNQEETQVWAHFLRNLYFNHQKINCEILVSAIKIILSAETIDSRTLGFLSHVIEKTHIDHIDDEQYLLRNRLGWLMEVSGKYPSYKPVKTQDIPIIKAPGLYSDPRAIKYLKRIQTKSGKRWHIYDTDLSQLKESFIGRLSTDS